MLIQTKLGWEEGLKDMCIGEKRTLTIPPEMGYGVRGYPPVVRYSASHFHCYSNRI